MNWKKVLLLGVGWGLGTAVGLALIIGGFLRYGSRPKAWNERAISAKFKKQTIYENHDKPSEPHYYVNIFFDVTNNIASDYVLPVDAWKKHLMEAQSGSLLGSTGWEFSLSQGSTPFKLPGDFFDSKPISVPAHATVEILLVFDSAFAPDAVKGKTKQQVVEGEFHQTDALVIFDDAAHYRINFPMKGIWEGKSQPSATLQ